MKKTNKGFTLVELLVVIGILGILMGALFPAISAAMLSANTSAMAMRGRNLFVGITQCNTEREAAGLAEVWPRDSDSEGKDNSDDIANKPASSTFQFFYDLFDMDHYGATEWDPYVNVDVGVLSGSGVQGMTGGKLQAQNIAWIIAKNISSEIADVIPVMVSRNVDYSALSSQLTGYNGTDTAKVVVGNGEWDTPFGNKAWVLVRKGGASQVIKAKYSRLDVVFNRQGFDNSTLAKPMSYMGLQ